MPACDECGRVFRDVIKLFMHMRQGHENRPHWCNKCLVYFNNEVELDGHRCKKRRLIEYQCKECDWTYESEQYLARHVKEHHGPMEPLYICEICNAPFYKQYKYTLHQREHLKCKCGKGFSTVTGLQVHGARCRKHYRGIYECNSCGRQFKYERPYVKHLQSEHGMY